MLPPPEFVTTCAGARSSASSRAARSSPSSSKLPCVPAARCASGRGGHSSARGSSPPSRGQRIARPSRPPTPHGPVPAARRCRGAVVEPYAVDLGLRHDPVPSNGRRRARGPPVHHAQRIQDLNRCPSTASTITTSCNPRPPRSQDQQLAIVNRRPMSGTEHAPPRRSRTLHAGIAWVGVSSQWTRRCPTVRTGVPEEHRPPGRGRPGRVRMRAPAPFSEPQRSSPGRQQVLGADYVAGHDVCHRRSASGDLGRVDARSRRRRRSTHLAEYACRIGDHGGSTVAASAHGRSFGTNGPTTTVQVDRRESTDEGALS